MPRVSIIIPAYNQARFLAKAIESALGQTHSDLEVIVVDDGSPDNTAEVAARFDGSQNFKYVRQANTGAAGARNRGIRESTGDYLCFLDADDYYVPEKVARQAAQLDADPSLGWVYCDFTTVDQAGRPIDEQAPIAKHERQLDGDLFGSLMLSGYFPPHVVMIRRAVLDRVGLWEQEFGGHMDYELWLRVAGAGFNAGFIPEPLAVYRTHPLGMSQDENRMNESRLATFQRIVRLHPDRAAAGLNQLQMSCKQLFATSQGLRPQMDAAALCPTGITGGAPEGPQICRIAPLLAKAVMTKGMPAQVAAWDVTIQGHFSKAIVMHPPVMLTLRLPTGAAGTLSVGIAMHPDVWNNPASGGCEFGIRVAGRINFAMALDPLHIESDRRWHEIQLAVPANSSGPHEVTFEVRCAGSPDFRWALWREPRFCWMSDAAACSGAPPARAEEPVALISS